GFFGFGLCSFFYFIELCFIGQAFFQYPLPHFQNTVVGFFPFQALLGLVALMRARGGVALWLGHFFHMYQAWDMGFTCQLHGFVVGFDKGRIIPALYGEDLQSIFLVGALKTRQRFGDGLFGSMVFVGYRNAIAIVP